MNLYDQLLQLQVLDNAFVEWKSYRNQLTTYIIEHTKNNGELAIFGGGRCNDLDLGMLAAHFSTITLLDRDGQAMKQGVSQYGLGEAPIIKREIVDFVGISSQEYRAYADTLISEIRKQGMNISCDELAQVAIKVLDDLCERALSRPLDFGLDTYENIVIIGVHSQLISMLEWIWSVILRTLKQNEDSVRNRIIQMNTIFVKRFNAAVLRATKKCIFIGCEAQIAGKIGTVQGAIQAIDDLKSRAKHDEIDILESEVMRWPFDQSQDLEYMMQVQKIVPKVKL